MVYWCTKVSRNR